MTEKTQFFEIILKFHPTKRENAFEKLNHISIVTSAVTETQTHHIPLARMKMEKLKFCSLFSRIWLKIGSMSPKVEELRKISIEMKEKVYFFIIREKSEERFRRGPDILRYWTALNQLISDDCLRRQPGKRSF